MPNAEDDVQNDRVGALEGFAEASVGSIKNLNERLQLQDARIAALTALSAKLVDQLVAAGTLKESDLAPEVGLLLQTVKR